MGSVSSTNRQNLFPLNVHFTYVGVDSFEVEETEKRQKVKYIGKLYNVFGSCRYDKEKASKLRTGS